MEFILNDDELADFYSIVGSKLNGTVTIEISIGSDNKAEIIQFFQQIKQNLNIPMLYVSHDKAEIEQLTNTLWYL